MLIFTRNEHDDNFFDEQYQQSDHTQNLDTKLLIQVRHEKKQHKQEPQETRKGGTKNTNRNKLGKIK